MKVDYEIVKYIIQYGERKECVESEEEAISLFKTHIEENPCVYQIRKMIID